MASFSGSHKQLDSQDNKVITSAIHCAGLNWFIIQSTFFSFYICRYWLSAYICLLLFKISQYIFWISVSFPAAFSSFVLCRKKCLGLLVLSFLPVLVKLNRMKQIYIYIWNYLNLQDFFFPPVLKYVEAVHLLSCCCEKLPRIQSYFSKCFLCLFCLTVRTL